MKSLSIKISGLCIILMSIQFGYAQEASKSHQFFGLNPMIQRDPLFQKIQNNLNSAMDKTEIGFDESLSSKYLSEIRSKVRGLDIKIRKISNQDVIQVVVKGIKSDSNVYKWPIKVTPNENIVILGDSLEYALNLFLEKNLRRPTPSHEQTGELSTLVLSRFYEMLTKNDNGASLDYRVVQTKVAREIRIELLAYLSFLVKDESFLVLNNSTNKNNFVNELSQEVSYFIEQKKEQLLELLDYIESEITQYDEKLSGTLAAANAGVSVSSEESDLGGGFYTSGKIIFKNDQLLEIGVYVNGSTQIVSDTDSIGAVIDTKDTGNVSITVKDQKKDPFLIGIALKWKAGPKIQINALGTMYFVQDVDRKLSYELGGGILYNTQTNLILGLSGFYQILDTHIQAEGKETPYKLKSQWSAGVTLYNTNPGAPTIFLGLSGQVGEKPVPAVQVSYPIPFVRS